MALDRKPLPKKEVMKLPAGTLVQLMWLDSEDTVEMLLEKPKYEKGDVDLVTWTTDYGVRTRAVHSQVVAVRGEVQLFSDEGFLTFTEDTK